MTTENVIKKYIFFTTENSIAPIAFKLEKEGNQVYLGQVEDLNLTLLDTEKKTQEDKELKKRRLSMYDGLLKHKVDAVKLLKSLKDVKNKDEYLVMSDSNSTFRFLEKAQSYGFTGLIHTQEDRSLEVHRDKGKSIVEENYPQVFLSEHHEFKKIEDGIKFLENNDNTYVLKSLGDNGETIVPKVDDPKVANQVIIDTLTKEKKDYEANGFLLEQKILNCVELTPQAVFWDGKLIYTSLDIETKTIGAGEKGPNVGCGANLVIRTNPEDRINKIAFPPYVWQEAKKRKGMYIIDAGLLFDIRTGKPYFTEFCTRLGWDAWPTEIAMAGDPDGEKIATPYFEKLLKGKNPLRVKFGLCVRLFNLNQDKDKLIESGLSITIDEKAEPDVYLYDVRKEKDQLVSAGFQKDLGCVTGVSNSLKEAIERCLEYADMVGFKDLLYRTQDDILSTSYPQAILRRLKYAVDKKLIGKIDLTWLEKEDNKLADIEQEIEMMKEKYTGMPYENVILDLTKKFNKLEEDYKTESNSKQAENEKNIADLKKKHADEMAKIKKAMKDAIYS